jgi:hypothetical protein
MVNNTETYNLENFFTMKQETFYQLTITIKMLRLKSQ